jgi:hypothetical protein
MAGSQDFSPDPRNARALIYLNGQLLPRAEARVSLFDGGFVVGDTRERCCFSTSISIASTGAQARSASTSAWTARC